MFETTVFDKWLQFIEADIQELPIDSALAVVKKRAFENHGVRLRFVKGATHSKSLPCLKPEGLPLGSDLYLIPEDWSALSDRDQAKLVVFLRRLVFFRDHAAW